MSAEIIPLFRPLILEGPDPLTIPKPPANARRFDFHKSADAFHLTIYASAGSCIRSAFVGPGATWKPSA
jgi:hypothetical protein